MRVFVYFNLHKKCWSVKALDGPKKGRVAFHATEVFLRHAMFKVSQAGRARVLKEQRKNVHAGVMGYLGGSNEGSQRVTYNPYKAGYFYRCDTGLPVFHSENVAMTKTGVYI